MVNDTFYWYWIVEKWVGHIIPFTDHIRPIGVTIVLHNSQLIYHTREGQTLAHSIPHTIPKHGFMGEQSLVHLTTVLNNLALLNVVNLLKLFCSNATYSYQGRDSPWFGESKMAFWSIYKKVTPIIDIYNLKVRILQNELKVENVQLRIWSSLNLKCNRP